MSGSEIADIDPALEVNVADLDDQLKALLDLTQFALAQQAIVPGKPWLLGLRFHCGLLLRAYWTTHTSIRELASHYDIVPEIAADAASLEREQVEKLFIIALLCYQPRKWVKQYLRNSWRSMLDQYLFQLDEDSGRVRFAAYLDQVAPSYLEMMRRLPAMNRQPGQVVVSRRAYRAATIAYHRSQGRTAAKVPTWYSKGYVDKYFTFPTPGGARDLIRDAKIKARLDRWYKEYKYSCEFSHVRARKILLHARALDKSQAGAEQLRLLAKRDSERAIFVSAIATVSSVTELLRVLQPDYGVTRLLGGLWDTLAEQSLIALKFRPLYQSLLKSRMIVSRRTHPTSD